MLKRLDMYSDHVNNFESLKSTIFPIKTRISYNKSFNVVKMNPTYSSVEIRTLCTYRLYPRPLSLTQFTRRLAQLDTRYRPRFFDQVGHQTTNASMGNKHFFTK